MLRLSQTLGASYPAEEDDVLGMKNALTQLGEYRPKPGGPSRWTDDELFDGMKRFQRKSGLQVDGVARPGGPTATSIGSALAETALAKTKTPTAKGGPSPTRNDAGSSTLSETPKKQAEARRAQAIAAAKRNNAAKVFGLTGAVGAGQANPAAGVQETKKALAWAGYYPPGRANHSDTTPDEDMTWGLASFQRDFGLKQDGFMRPGGETETRLNALIAPLVQLAVQNGTVKGNDAAPILSTTHHSPTPVAAPAQNEEPKPDNESPPPEEPDDDKPDERTPCEKLADRLAEIEPELARYTSASNLIAVRPVNVDRSRIGEYVQVLIEFGDFSPDPLPDLWVEGYPEDLRTVEIGTRLATPKIDTMVASVHAVNRARELAKDTLASLIDPLEVEVDTITREQSRLGCGANEKGGSNSPPRTPSA